MHSRNAKHITILSGGGSPHAESYRSVYELIEKEALRRGFTTHLIDYVGTGHHPEIGAGLSLPTAVEKARKDLKEYVAPEGSTLLCRSIGCHVGAFLLAHYAAEMAAFERVILWGPSSYHLYWNLVARTPNALREMNEYATKHAKGLRLHDNFWSTFEPIEEAAKKFGFITVEIGWGTRDGYCDGAFVRYLAEIIWNNTDCPLRLVEIEGADHEVRFEPPAGVSEEAHSSIMDAYLKLIFRN